MVRRRLTLKRLDPWSVLKFGFVANLVLLVMFLLVALVVWFIIDQLALVDQVCDIALDVGFTQCGVNFGNLFRALILLGLLWVVVQTAVLVFLSFLHNLLADLTGGLAVTVNDTTPGAAMRAERTGRSAQAGQRDGTGGGPGVVPAVRHSEGPAAERERTGTPPVPPVGRDAATGARGGRDDRDAATGARGGRDDRDAATGGRDGRDDREAPRSREHPPADSGELMFGERSDPGRR